MTAQLLATGVGMIVGAILMLSVQPGIDVVRAIVGKDRCFGGDALNGCSTWANGTLLCGILVFSGWPHGGYASWAVVPTVPAAAILLWSAWYCLLAHRNRRREFAVRDGAIVRISDGMHLEPEFASPSSLHTQTGPATGYGASVLELGSGDSILATNVYIDADLAERDLREILAVAGPRGCRSLDLMFVLQSGPRAWQTVPLRPDWTPLLCGRLEHLPEMDRAWWRQWLQPDFGRLGRRTVPTGEVADHLHRLAEAYPWLLDKNPADPPDHEETPVFNALMGSVRTHDTIRALRALLARSSSVDVTTSAAHHEMIEASRRVARAWVECSFDEDGVLNEVVREEEKRSSGEGHCGGPQNRR